MSTSAAPPAAATATATAAAASPHVPNTGGAWEAIIDRAATQVTEYLASSTKPFDPTALLSNHMLHLLDRSTLRDVVVERNCNALCGCLGCGNKPRGLMWGDGAATAHGGAGSGSGLSFEWSESSSTSEIDNDDDGSEDGEEEEAKDGRGVGDASAAKVKKNHAAAEKDGGDVDVDDKEEIVYDDDVYTAESFRLAQRQRALLNRIERKKQKRERAMLAGGLSKAHPPSTSMHAGAARVLAPRVRRSGMLGASFPQRFCSAECEEVFDSLIAPRVSLFASHDYPTVFSAITNLFPNLSVASLQQLAGAEVSASWLVKPIQEKTSGPAEGTQSALRPVQVGVSFESSEHLSPARGNKATTKKQTPAVVEADESPATESRAEHQQQQQLRDVLEQMHVLQSVWNHEVVPRFSDSHLPRVPAETPHATTTATSTTKTDSVSARNAPRVPSVDAAVAAPLSALPAARPRPALRGALLLFDFIMNITSARTRCLFRLHYTAQRRELQSCVNSAHRTPANGGPSSLTFFSRVSSAVIAAMENRCAALAAKKSDTHDAAQLASDNTHISTTELDSVYVADDSADLRIDPLQQQQRRELLVSHLFSEDVTATLSRLLMVDYVVLSNTAWSGVWFREFPLTILTSVPASAASSASSASPTVKKTRELCSLLRSLQFPFALPAALLRSASTSPEVMGLAIVFLVAAGCCSAAAWRGFMRDDVALEEVAEVIGLTQEEVTAAVCALMLGGEDDDA